jgi:hypothetical protein
MVPMLLLTLLLGASDDDTWRAEDLNKRISTGGDIRPEARILRVNNRDLQIGSCTYHFDEGELLPVRNGRGEVGETSGFIFEGSGVLTVDFETRAEAWRFANHMVLVAGHKPEEVAHIARGEPYQVAIKRGVVVSRRQDVLDMLLPPKVEVEGEGEGTDTGEPDMTVLVEDQRGVVAGFIRAGQTLPNRLGLMLMGGLDLRPRFSDELLREAWGGVEDSERVVWGDFLTTDHFGVARGPDAQIVLNQDRWLTCLDDGLGVIETGERASVFAHGWDPDGRYHRVRFTGQDWAPEQRRVQDVPGLAARDFEPVSADFKIELYPIRMRKYVHATVESEITVEAQRDGVQRLVLTLPRYEGRNNTWELVQLADQDGRSLPWTTLGSEQRDRQGDGSDGQTLADADVDASTSEDASSAPTQAGLGGGGAGTDQGSLDDGSGGTTTDLPQNDHQVQHLNPDRSWMRYDIVVLLDEPLKAGDQVTLQLDWTTEWNFGQFRDVGGYPSAGGPTTGFRNVLPQLYPNTAGTRWDFSGEVTLPDVQGFELAASGTTRRSQHDQDRGTYTYILEGDDVLRPGVALGKWGSWEEPASPGWPAIQVHLHLSESYALKEFGPELRRVLGFYRKLMPPLWASEFDIYQGADLSGPRSTEPGDGMLEINQRTVVDQVGAASYQNRDVFDPYMEQTLLAREVARRYWSGLVQPAGLRDAWMSEVMPEVYASYYVRGVHGTQAFFDWQESIRAVLEDPQEHTDRLGKPQNMSFSLALTDTGTMRSYGETRHYYGAYVVGNSLRYRVGENVYYQALDQLLEDKNGGFLTTEDLQASLERSSGVDLDDFFDFWIDGGFMPGIQATVSQEGGTVRACLTSDVPFGTVEVPVVVTDQGGFRSQQALVRVTDGRGSFELGDRADDVTVEIDPDGLFLFTQRKVKDGETTCFEGAGE